MIARPCWLFSIAVLAASAAGAADLYRWTDDNGKTHYGDSVPKRYKDRAKKIQGAAEVSQQDRKRAVQRAAKDKAQAEAVEKAKQRASIPAASGAPIAAKAPERPSCEEQLRRFKESADCFAQYSLPNGGTRPEAFEHCKEMKQPNC